MRFEEFFLILTYFDFFLERKRRIPFDFQRTSLAGLALESATSSGLGRAPALQCRTPSRHHLELQDRRDYTPADRAARTCCVCAYHSTPFTAEWSVRKTSIAWSTLDAEQQTSPPPMITPPAAIPDHLWQRVEATWSVVPQEHIQSLLECVAVDISTNEGYSGY
ncbi:hypothetical protein TNCV_5039221 [Trichonephila clavipes]|nr:hypothetical protein TNCV_5039221 [Trichonephila clavipes]